MPEKVHTHRMAHPIAFPETGVPLWRAGYPGSLPGGVWLHCANTIAHTQHVKIPDNLFALTRKRIYGKTAFRALGQAQIRVNRF